MSVKAAAERTHQDLKKALAIGKFPANVADTAVKLPERLKEPVRLSIMGLPGSGKTTVANLLLNKLVIPEGVNLPTTQFLHGEAPAAVCTLPDGRHETVPGADPHDIEALKPMFVEFHLPLAALGRISVLEVCASDDPQDQRRALMWAAKRTDMALWCTQTFSSIEQALWDTMPDKVKDHAFMLVTRADQVAQSGNLEQLLDEIRFASAHQFNKIMPIATTDAIASRRADGTVDKSLMQKSGGLTLISSILRQVDQGLQSTVDQADLILHKFRDAEPNPETARSVDDKPKPRVISELLPDTKAAEPVADAKPVVEVVTSRPIATGSSRPIEAAQPDEPQKQDDAFVMRSRPISVMHPTESRPEPVAVPRAEPEPQATKPAPVKKPRIGFMPKTKSAVEAPRAKPETCAAYAEAISYLTQQGRELSHRIASGDDIESDDLMQASADNITWLSEYLDDVSVKDDPVLEKARTRALDATELVQLMQFESNDDAGIEALSLVIQLKRDLQADIAQADHARPVKAA